MKGANMADAIEQAAEIVTEARRPKHILEINGQTVIFKARISHRESKEIRRLSQEASKAGDDWDAQIPLMVKLVESWGFEGDPHDPESYQLLDDFDEFWPLAQALGAYLSARIARLADAKN